MKKYIIVKDLLLKKFLHDKTFIRKFKNEKSIIFIYDGFYIVEYESVSIINVFDENIYIYNDMIDVTNNIKYDNFCNNVINSNIILEGPDGVGKTTIAKSFAEEGIIVQDREINNITKMMHEYVNPDFRNQTVINFLNEHLDKNVLFLMLTEENLKSRLDKRKVLSEYDKKNLVYRKLYLQTFMDIKRHVSNLYLIECDNYSVEEVKKKVIKYEKR